MCKIDVNHVEENSILELRDVTYVYEGERLPVWEHLSCRFFRGKIHAISGPSGCGKSSILYLLDGLIPHMYEGKVEGQILLEGKEIMDMLPRYRCDKIGFVMQNPESQFCTFTVAEELAFGMENLGFSKEKMQDKIKEILEYVGMEGYEAYDLNNLSGGQKQKVAIASLVVTEPEILLLDEPTANLDPESRKQIFDLIVKLSKEKGMTIILVEHNIEEILGDVDYLMALDHEGQVVLNGPRNQVETEFHNMTLKTEAVVNPCGDVPRAKEVVMKIRGLEFAYPIPGRKKDNKPKKILNQLDLDIQKQDFLAIVGENGVGKTTLMRLIFRIFKQDQGSIELFGKEIDSYKKGELYHQIGLVFQNPENQFITNTVYDEMMFSLKRVKISQEEKEKQIENMLLRFHLEKEKDKSPFVLSQGQKRRLSVASMLLTNQKILFLDEPTYGQDYENRQELMKDMCSLVRDGITIVMITHDMDLVKQYASRVVEIEKGRVKRDLPKDEFFEWCEHRGEDQICLRT